MNDLSLKVLDDGRASVAGEAPAGGTGAEFELTDIHDFATKLTQPDAIRSLRAYVQWQSARRNRLDAAALGGEDAEAIIPDFAPVSINLDLTTACNYACDHCVDMDILNTGTRFDHEKLLASLELMTGRGLRSVIVIGGGEPTLYPKFVEVIRFMKSLGLQVAIVSNGAGNLKIAQAADCLDRNDWVRLSLDAGTDPTFQKMHKPKKPVTLEAICALVPSIREANPDLTVGFSYIVTWLGAFVNDTHIVENLHEIARAAELARDSRFSYIAFKPFLTRDELHNAEVIGMRDRDQAMTGVIARIEDQLRQARTLAGEGFRVIETTGLKAMIRGQSPRLKRQPNQCHMQFFRQVLSPLGLYNCPVYRNQPHGKLGEKDANAGPDGFNDTRRQTAELIHNFNAETICEKVTCLYNDVNWWIESLIKNPGELDNLKADHGEPDYFL